MEEFEGRRGPAFDPPVQYPPVASPEWFGGAKLGFFIHWGIYSVPAFAPLRKGRAVGLEDLYTIHQYAEWYANTVRIPGSPTARFHEETYGVGVSYEDLADRWLAEDFDAQRLIDELAEAGGRYIVPTTKHHDGFCLWDTDTTGFTSVNRGPRRDLIDEIAGATRNRGLRLGLYFSGGLDWHVSDFPPIQSSRELFTFRRNDPAFAAYSLGQLRELVERYRPEVLWNDIEWPDSGKGHDGPSLARFFEWYLREVPEGTLNDRWGVPYHGYITREYRDVAEKSSVQWELTRGLGVSFGHNTVEADDDHLTDRALVHLLIDTVSKGGNLLLNVGPTAAGTLPPIQSARLRALGDWLRINGEAIYDTVAWTRFGDEGLRYTTGAGNLYVHVLTPGSLDLPLDVAALASAGAEWVGAPGAPVDTVPAALADAPAAVLKVSMGATR